jgi:hypothetical protein
MWRLVGGWLTTSAFYWFYAWTRQSPKFAKRARFCYREISAISHFGTQQEKIDLGSRILAECTFGKAACAGDQGRN